MSNTIDFQATTGPGSEIVQVIMSYEEDIDGTYDENIESVKFEGVEVIGLISQDQFADLEIEGCKAINEKKIWQLENYEP
jgi:hypothetical protein